MTDPQPDRRRGPAEVRLTDETISYIEQRIASAVGTGLKSAMTEDTAAAFWAAGLSVLQKQATQHAGRFVLGGLLDVVRKLGLFLTLGGIVYALGGWSALAALFKVLFQGGGH